MSISRCRHYPILARDVVRHVGDAIAFVVADTLDQAKDAAEAISVDWQPLPHVIGADRGARARRAAGLAGPARQSRLRNAASATRRRPRIAFAKAARTVDAHHRQSAAGDQLYRHPRRRSPNTTASAITLTLGSQGSHIIRDIIGGEVLKLPPEQDARGHARCRRRLRHQAFSLSRICAGRGRRAAPAQAGEMDWRPLRAFPRRQPRPRQYLHRAAGARRQGPLSRA